MWVDISYPTMFWKWKEASRMLYWIWVSLLRNPMPQQLFIDRNSVGAAMDCSWGEIQCSCSRVWFLTGKQCREKNYAQPVLQSHPNATLTQHLLKKTHIISCGLQEWCNIRILIQVNFRSWDISLKRSFNYLLPLSRLANLSVCRTVFDQLQLMWFLSYSLIKYIALFQDRIIIWIPFHFDISEFKRGTAWWTSELNQPRLNLVEKR